MSVGLPLVASRRSYSLPFVSVRTRFGLVNGWSRTVAALSFGAALTSAIAEEPVLSSPVPQAERASAAAAANATAVTAFLLRMEEMS